MDINYNIIDDSLNDKIKYVYHIADIHIRLYKRHDEYLQVFENLYNELSKQKDLSESVIVILGDILHSKNDLAPELIQIVINFFSRLSDLLPVFVIAGNHDANLANKNRLDSLSPITDMIVNTKYLFKYFKNSGVYIYKNLSFVVNSVFDDVFIKASEIDSKMCEKRIKICLWHGTVDQCKLFNNTTLSNESIKISSFEGFDITMLGDIHKHQFLNEFGNIAYSGSLIQQNFGESVSEHGLIRWNVKSKKGKFINIKNDYGYYTLQINEPGKIEIINCNNTKSYISKYPRIKIKISNSISNNDQIKVINEIKKKYNPKDIQIENIKNETYELKNLVESNIIDITQLEYQNGIIKDILQKKLININKINKIIEINNNAYYSANYLDFNDWSWELIELTFSNMFCYGENNKIRFDNKNGTIGIVAPNCYGKSSIIDIILFSLYDKMSRGKRTDILNKNTENFICKLVIKIGDSYYQIERKGSNKNNKILVSFSKISYDNGKIEIIESYNGEQRKETQKMIESYIGTYNESISSIISLQGKELGIIDMGQKDRKQFISKLLKLDLLDKQYDIVNKQNKELECEVKILKRNLLNIQPSKDLEKQISIQEKYLNEQTIRLNKLLTSKKVINEKYNFLISTKIEVSDKYFKDKNLIQLQELYFINNNTFNNNFNKINNLNIYIKYLDKQKNNIKDDKYHKCGMNIKELENDIQSIDDSIENIQSRIFNDSDIIVYDEKQLTKEINSLQLLIDNKNILLQENLETCNLLKKKVKLFDITDDSFQIEMSKLRKENKKLSNKINEIYQEIIVLKENDIPDLDTTKNLLESKKQDYNSCSDKIQKYLHSFKKNPEQKFIDKIVKKLNDIFILSNEFGDLKFILKEQEKYMDIVNLNKKLNKDKVIYETSLTVIDNNICELNDKYQKVNNLNQEISNINLEISNLNNQIGISNSDLETVKSNLSNLENNQKKLYKNKKYKKELEKLKNLKKSKKIEKDRISDTFSKLNDKLQLYDTNIIDCYNQINSLELENKELNIFIEKINSDIKNINTHNKNTLIDSELLELKQNIDIYNTEEENIKQLINDNNRNLFILQEDLKKVTDYQEQLKNLDDNILCNKIYLDLMGPKGIQKDLISKSLPIIEYNVNMILNTVVDYSLKISMEENDIDISLIYPDYKSTSIELACGSERFISSIALRTAILEISRTNKPTFFSIDEGWGSLDSDNLSNVENLLSCLSERFKIILIISHISSLKNEMSNMINIDKIDGYSHIYA